MTDEDVEIVLKPPLYECIRCGKELKQYGKLCDDCVIAVYFIAVVRPDLDMAKVAKYYGMCANNLRKRIKRLKNEPNFPERFIEIGRKCIRDGLKLTRIDRSWSI